MRECVISETDIASASMTVSPNIIEAVGQSLLRVYMERGEWWGSLHCTFRVQRGQLDRINLDVPGHWLGPFDIESDVPITVGLPSESLPADSSNGQPPTVALKLAKTLGEREECSFKLTGPIARMEGKPLELPSISVNNAYMPSRFVVVPSALGGIRIAWTHDGGARDS